MAASARRWTSSANMCGDQVGAKRVLRSGFYFLPQAPRWPVTCATLVAINAVTSMATAEHPLRIFT